ncbi:MAG: hypothetical protein QXG16_04790 [Candidatus Anstonellaceae archaeon]
MRKVVTKEGITFTIGTAGNDIIIISDKYAHPFDDPYELGVQLKIESEKINLEKINVIFNLIPYHNVNSNKNVIKLIYDKNKQTITMEE